MLVICILAQIQFLHISRGKVCFGIYLEKENSYDFLIKLTLELVINKRQHMARSQEHAYRPLAACTTSLSARRRRTAPCGTSFTATARSCC
jgi:hypothetical protein